MEFSQNIKKHLKDKNLSRVAREVGMPRSLLHEWVHANRTPSLRNMKHLKSLANYLAVSVGDLLLGEASKPVLATMVFEDDGVKYRIKIERV